jgi:hypothetical protein
MTKSRVAQLAFVVVATYAVLWAVTALFGAPQVREAALRAMVKRAATTYGRVPRFSATAVSPVPLLVVVDYGEFVGPLDSYGTEEWHLWFFGAHGHIRTVWTYIT